MIFLMVMMELSQLSLAIEFGEDDDGDEEILDDEFDDRKSVGLGHKIVRCCRSSIEVLALVSPISSRHATLKLENTIEV